MGYHGTSRGLCCLDCGEHQGGSEIGIGPHEELGGGCRSSETERPGVGRNSSDTGSSLIDDQQRFGGPGYVDLCIDYLNRSNTVVYYLHLFMVASRKLDDHQVGILLWLYCQCKQVYW